MYYLIFNYQQRLIYQDDYHNVKQELLSQKNEIPKSSSNNKPYKINNNTIQPSSSSGMLTMTNLDVDFYPQSPF
jgi:hypothetical protein